VARKNKAVVKIATKAATMLARAVVPELHVSGDGGGGDGGGGDGGGGGMSGG
jgi:hypothetical protein